MFNSSFKIATVWGIPIKVHISLIVWLLFIALYIGLPGGPTAILFMLILGVCIFASIALHELGHSFVAIRKGCRVREITLLFIGGAAKMEEIPTRPMDEFQMAVSGPAVSLVLGAIGYLGGRYFLLHGFPLLGLFIASLGKINFFLTGFNLLPAFPMDGGRVFRALITPKFGRLRATFIAARLGKIMAVLFGIYGFISQHWILVFIAFFIYTAAGNEYRMVQFQEAARQQGFNFWSTFQERRNGYSNDDKVMISPPPFESGPGSETTIHSMDDDG